MSLKGIRLARMCGGGTFSEENSEAGDLDLAQRVWSRLLAHGIWGSKPEQEECRPRRRRGWV